MIIRIRSSARNPIGAVLGRLIQAAYDFSLKHEGEFYKVEVDGEVDEKGIKQLIDPVIRTHKKGDFQFLS